MRCIDHVRAPRSANLTSTSKKANTIREWFGNMIWPHRDMYVTFWLGDDVLFLDEKREAHACFSIKYIGRPLVLWRQSMLEVLANLEHKPSAY